MSGLDDYTIKNKTHGDKFEPNKTTSFAFPCSACIHNSLDDSQYPCSKCDHNLNAMRKICQTCKNWSHSIHVPSKGECKVKKTMMFWDNTCSDYL